MPRANPDDYRTCEKCDDTLVWSEGLNAWLHQADATPEFDCWTNQELFAKVEAPNGPHYPEPAEIVRRGVYPGGPNED